MPGQKENKRMKKKSDDGCEKKDDEPEEPSIPWKKSQAKRLLYKDIMDGVVRLMPMTRTVGEQVASRNLYDVCRVCRLPLLEVLFKAQLSSKHYPCIQ
jgi:hypothetical protein